VNRRSPNQCFGHSRTRTNANTGIPAWTPPLRLPRQATTAELGLVNLIAQHDPESNPQLPRRRDAGFRKSLLHDLPSIEALQLRIPAHGTRRRLAPEKPQERISLFAERAESLPFAARILPRDDADGARDCLSVENRVESPTKISVANAVTGPTPGRVMSNVARARSFATCWTRSSSRSMWACQC
jgi:hypothetical protein